MPVGRATRRGRMRRMSDVPRSDASLRAAPTSAARTHLRRRAAVHVRAIRRELTRIRQRRRIVAMTLLIVTFGLIAAGIIARGEPAGADARAYWAGVRIWLNGGD